MKNYLYYLLNFSTVLEKQVGYINNLKSLIEIGVLFLLFKCITLNNENFNKNKNYIYSKKMNEINSKMYWKYKVFNPKNIINESWIKEINLNKL